METLERHGQLFFEKIASSHLVASYFGADTNLISKPLQLELAKSNWLDLRLSREVLNCYFKPKLRREE